MLHLKVPQGAERNLEKKYKLNFLTTKNGLVGKTEAWKC